MKIWVFSKRSVVVIALLLVILLIGIVYFLNLGRGGLNVFAPQRRLPIYSVETSEKVVAISFDAAWGDEFTDDILDALDKYNVKTTFFLVGFWVDKYPDWVKEMHERGHEVGNHSSTHPHMSKLSKADIAKELKVTGDKIFEITGVQPTVFRPPFGDYNNLLIETAEELGYYTIQWDVDSLDWKEMGVQPVVDRVTRNVKNGSIILFHNNAKYVAEFLPLVLERLQEQGYKIVPISDLIIKENYIMDPSGRQVPKP
ncbi:polysaccharide deacetylase family protein [Alkaliphilus peptidifermentans]|uniref:Polysaccharide deacetylase family sporulation protein PdaB n=1 Tax=Alkaliphilus peptidifermentans DSM 18978 TaxID=1120976 RepID=A0A1G5K840_9FIRM|nr:polysaccharide deacetylase family protein [Alkaliphilus peptidifermentans]SCY96584.1 polysaccharide deacetylase family sporulation protein PdaB [Alkaliphilus peptidifermentans DSM 18978]